MGQLARDALLLILSVSAQHEAIADFVANKVFLMWIFSFLIKKKTNIGARSDVSCALTTNVWTGL